MSLKKQDMMIATLSTLIVVAGCASPPTVSAPTTAPAAGTVDDLLTRVEASADDLRDFEANIRYWKIDSVLNREELRHGTVIYQVKPEGGRRFAVLLEFVIVGNRQYDRPKHYVFDGTWLAEIDHDKKQFIKRQVVPPGEQFDPLKLGEGPFPMPVGQPASEVRARFEVTLRDTPADEKLVERLADRDVEGLHLVPKSGTPEAEEFADVEIFYDTATLLPVGISAVELNGDRKIVLLTKPKRNEGIDESKLSIEVPDKTGWAIDIQRWQGS